MKLDLQRYAYPDISTITLSGKRFYALTDELAYPSITSILGQTQPPETADWINKWKARVGNEKAEQVRNAAASRGTNVHLMLERYARGEDIIASQFPPEHVKLFNSLKASLSRVTTIVGQEVALFSAAFEVAGRCDMIAEYDGELCIVDYKTSTRVKTEADIGDYWLQCAFYALAHNEMYGTNIEKMVIMMGVEGKLPLTFKKRITDEHIIGLANRVGTFYDKLEASL
jgi:ATP-dependent exoDNAse (exonuclease V) beta subunit